jgi:CBS domain-containing protein
MRIGDVMTTNLPTVSPDDTIGDAARRMSEAGVRALPVCEGERLAGMITDWDVTRAVADGSDPCGRLIIEYMSRPSIFVEPDAHLTTAAEAMADSRTHHLLVCEGERFAGMVHLDIEWAHVGGLETPTPSFTAPI